MSQIKKHTWKGLAVAAAMLLSVGLMSQTVFAAAPTVVNVIIDETNGAGGGDDDSVASSATATTTIRIVADIDDAGGQTDETIVTFTSAIGTWAGSGTNSIQVECAIDGAVIAAPAATGVDDDDTAANSTTLVGISKGVYSNTAESGVDDEAALAANEQGCLGVEAFLVLPANAAAGTYSITAQTLNGVADVESLIVTAPVGTTASAIASVSGTNPTHKAIGFTTAGTYEPLVNGAIWTIRVTDASGAGVNGVQVQFDVDQGAKIGVVQDGTTDSDTAAGSELDVMDECTSTTTKGTSTILTTNTIGTSSTNTGRARIVICGASAAAGKKVTATAKTLGVSTFTTTTELTVANRPTSGDVKITTTAGGQINVEVMVGGVPAADDLDVIFAAIPDDNTVVVPGCVSLLDGKASAISAVTPGTPASVVVSVFDNGPSGGVGSNSPVECDGTPFRLAGSAQAILGGGGGGGTTTPPPAQGTCGGFIGTAPARGSIALLVTNGTCTAQQLVAAFATAGCTVESLAILEGGVWKIYINGAPAVVNAAFPASLPPTTAFFVRCQA